MNLITLDKKISKYFPFVLFFIIGAFILNIDQESISFAATLKNYNIYIKDNSYLEIIKNSDFTIQTYLPYLLMKLNFTEKFLNIFFSGLTSLISMASIYILSLKISRNYTVSLIIPLILLSHNFINTRSYGIHYPTDFFYFGQMGMYLTLLSITLFVYEEHEKGINIFIINLFCHAAWGLFNLFILLLIYFMYKRKNILFLSNIFFFFSCFLIVFISLYILKNNSLLVNLQESSIMDGYGNFKNIINNDFNYVSETHKLIIIENHLISKETLFNFFRFIFYDFIFLITFIMWRKSLDSKLLKLFKVLFISIILIYIGLLFYNHFFLFFKSLSNYFAVIYERLVINRFLNLINMVVICSHLLIFFNSLKRKSKKIYTQHYIFISLLILVNIFFFETKLDNENYYLNYIDIYNIIIWAVIPYNFFERIKNNYVAKKI